MMFRGIGVSGLRVGRRALLPVLVMGLMAGAVSARAAAPAVSAHKTKTNLDEAYGRLPMSFERNEGQTAAQVKFLARGNGYGLFLTGRAAVLSLRTRVPGASPATMPTSTLLPRSGGKSPDLVRVSRRPLLDRFGIGPEADEPKEISTGLKPLAAEVESVGPDLSASPVRTDVIRMQLAGANPDSDPDADPVGEERLPGTSNYFIGNDPAQWRTGVANFGKVRYRGVYRGIDLVYYGNQRQLEYDFVVAPGADPGAIQLHFDGADAVKLTAGGDLALAVGRGEVAFHKPVVYQTIDGRKRLVAGEFALGSDDAVGFKLGRYDRSRPLVIDPVLVYSTFLGGTEAEFVVAVAVDASGNGYATGLTGSTDFPLTPGAFQSINYATTASAVSTAFVSKLNASGTALVYSTFLGGNATANTLYNQGDYGHAIAVDGSGNAYVAGYTYSSNFPITSNAFLKTDVPGENRVATGFVTKINPVGTGLVYSTYLGGSELTEPGSIAIDTAGDAFISGQTFSKDFPVTSGAFQTVNHGAANNGANLFVTKMNPAGSGLVYSTYLGGSQDTGSIFPQLILTNPIAVDKSGNAYVASFTESGDFPVTKGAYQTLDQSQSYIATVSKLNPAGSALLYSTFLGGDTSYTFPQGIAIDTAGNAYVGGFTACTDYPVTAGAFQATNKADRGSNYTDSANDNGFLTKINPAGSALVYSTYLGGTTGPWGGDTIYGVAVDSSGDAYVSGGAMSADFPVTSNAYQSKNKGATHCCDYLTYTPNAFLTEFNPAGTALVYSTYLGGSGTQNPEGAGGAGDEAYALALGANGRVLIAGYTSSSNFPVTAGAFEGKYTSEQNTGFVAGFLLGAAPTTKGTTTTLASSAISAIPGTKVTFTATVAAASGTAAPTGNVVFTVDLATVATVALSGSGSGTGTASYSTAGLAAGAHYILASYVGNTTWAASGDGLDEMITPLTPVISPAAGTYESQQTVTISNPTPSAVIYYSLDGSTPSRFGIPYTGPITVNAARTVQAVAVAANSADSTVVSSTFFIIGTPSVLAAPATAIATPKATLNAYVNTLGLAGSYYFQYGTSAAALTTHTTVGPLAASSTRVAVSAPLAALVAKTTYYSQVVVTTAGGTVTGPVVSFTTN